MICFYVIEFLVHNHIKFNTKNMVAGIAIIGEVEKAKIFNRTCALDALNWGEDGN